MLFFRPLPEATLFVSRLSNDLAKWDRWPLSNTQAWFIALMITAMVLQGQICWAAIDRATMGGVTTASLSWLLRRAKIPWALLLKAAVTALFEIFGITNAHIVFDDTDRVRSKTTRKLFGVFKTKDKKTGGYCNAQNVVFILLVTDVFTVPIGFAFYRPDPKVQKWKADDKVLRKKGIKKKNRPPKPESSRYPNRIELAQKLLARAQKFFSGITVVVDGKVQPIRIVSVLADAAFLTKGLGKYTHHYFPKAQLISQVAKNQICWNKSGTKKSVEAFFANQVPVTDKVKIRGGAEKLITYCSARLFIKSHGVRLHIVALKYDNETEYRYLAATELTWRTLDIIRTYSLRWLIEVAIEDWKQHDGYGRKAYQQGAEGACRGVILSLLVDCFLLQSSQQLRLYRAGKPLCTAGSLVRAIQFETIVSLIREVVECPDPQAALKKLTSALPHIFVLRPSSKHMQGRDIGGLGPSPHLVHTQRTGTG